MHTTSLATKHTLDNKFIHTQHNPHQAKLNAYLLGLHIVVLNLVQQLGADERLAGELDLHLLGCVVDRLGGDELHADQGPLEADEQPVFVGVCLLVRVMR